MNNYSLVFETQAPVVSSNPNRADIALFIGFVGRRDTPVPTEIQRWLQEQGWTSPPYERAAAREGTDGAVPSLLDIPIPLESWDIFDHLFAWEQQPLNFDPQEPMGTTYLGAAIRSFFAQGGKRCYLVRVGNPWAFTTSREKRLEKIAKLIPGYCPYQRGTFAGSPVERQGWKGVGHLFGLPDVSFLCLPDLPNAVSIDRLQPDVSILPEETSEQFVECSEPEAMVPPDKNVWRFLAPRCDEIGYQEWAKALNLVADLLARQQREVQLVAGVPIPQVGKAAEQNLWKFLSHSDHSDNQVDERKNDGNKNEHRVSVKVKGALSRPLNNNNDLGLASAFLQLVYPWVRTLGSVNLPEQLENPDAVLVGILARNALTRGTFRSAANLSMADVYELFPVLSRAEILERHQVGEKNTRQRSLLERVSFFAPTPEGLKLLSDVTTSMDENYRPASVNRLVSAIIRAARRLGEDLVFEVSGERLWSRLRESLKGLLLGLYRSGALRGDSPEAAFRVRCDRTTMTQNDIDAGRVIVEIQFAATFPLELITIVLAMSDGGRGSFHFAMRN